MLNFLLHLDLGQEHFRETDYLLAQLLAKTYLLHKTHRLQYLPKLIQTTYFLIILSILICIALPIHAIILFIRNLISIVACNNFFMNLIWLCLRWKLLKTCSRIDFT